METTRRKLKSRSPSRGRSRSLHAASSSAAASAIGQLFAGFVCMCLRSSHDFLHQIPCHTNPLLKTCQWRLSLGLNHCGTNTLEVIRSPLTTCLTHREDDPLMFAHATSCFPTLSGKSNVAPQTMNSVQRQRHCHRRRYQIHPFYLPLTSAHRTHS